MGQNVGDPANLELICCKSGALPQDSWM
jgi:hypothetical protein